MSAVGTGSLKVGDLEMDLIARTVGVGTRYLDTLRPGDVVNVLGPLGRGFVLPPARGIALLVGGGVGIPPMLYLAEAVGREMSDASIERPRRAVAFCGAMSRDLMPLTITNDAATAPTTSTSSPVTASPPSSAPTTARSAIAAS